MLQEIRMLLKPAFDYVDIGYYEMVVYVLIKTLPFLVTLSTDTVDAVEIGFLECWDEMLTKVTRDARAASALLRMTERVRIDSPTRLSDHEVLLESLHVSCLNDDEKMAVVMCEIVRGFQDRVHDNATRVTSKNDRLLDEISNAFINLRFSATEKRL